MALSSRARPAMRTGGCDVDISAVDRSATRQDGWLRALPAPVKLLALGAVITTAISVDGIIVPVVLVALLVLLAMSSRVDLRLAVPLALYPALFALLFAISSAAGVEGGAILVVRAVVSALAAVLVILTTPYPMVFATLQRVLPGLVADALLLTYRTLFILLGKFASLLRAARLRSGGTRRGLLGEVRILAPAFGGLILYSLDLAQRSYDVMRVRGYSGRLMTGTNRALPAKGTGTMDIASLFSHSADEDGLAVKVSCIRHSYEDGTTVHLCGLDFVARRGERTVLLGPNGSGKTTLLYHVLGLLHSTEGTVRVLDADPVTEWPAISRRVGVVLQNVDEQLLMPTVRDDVAFSARQYGLDAAEVDARVDAVMDLLDITELGPRVPHALSGGEKRKVALAGALVMGPELLVLDEPFEGLDPAARTGIVHLLERISHEFGTAIVMSTHDIDAVAELADYCYVLKTGGEIALTGTPGEVFARADEIARSNIRPPVLAELFAELKAAANDAPDPRLTVRDASAALIAWRASGAVTPPATPEARR